MYIYHPAQHRKVSVVGTFNEAIDTAEDAAQETFTWARVKGEAMLGLGHISLFADSDGQYHGMIYRTEEGWR